LQHAPQLQHARSIRQVVVEEAHVTRVGESRRIASAGQERAWYVLRTLNVRFTARPPLRLGG